jgi:hypothetical protein
MSYAANFPVLFRRSADFVDKILRGAKPGEIPVEHARANWSSASELCIWRLPARLNVI